MVSERQRYRAGPRWDKEPQKSMVEGVEVDIEEEKRLMLGPKGEYLGLGSMLSESPALSDTQTALGVSTVEELGDKKCITSTLRDVLLSKL